MLAGGHENKTIVGVSKNKERPANRKFGDGKGGKTRNSTKFLGPRSKKTD